MKSKKQTERDKSVSDRENKLRRNYGLSLVRYNEMLEKQNNSCAICGKHESEQKRSLAVDHNHATGKVRALLCTNCNRALGNVYENPDILQAMIDYLRRYND